MAYISDEELLSMIVMEGKLSTMRILLNGGVDVDHAVGNGFTALMLACKGEFTVDVEDSLQEKIVLSLLEAGANANLRDIHGRTSLMLACKSGCSIGVLAYLLECGADPSLRDNKERTAFHYAIKNHHNGIANYLREFELCSQQHFYMELKGTDKEIQTSTKDKLKNDIKRNANSLTQTCSNFKSLFENSKVFNWFAKSNKKPCKNTAKNENMIKPETATDEQTRNVDVTKNLHTGNLENHETDKIDNVVTEKDANSTNIEEDADAKQVNDSELSNIEKVTISKHKRKSQMIDQNKNDKVKQNTVSQYCNGCREDYAYHITKSVEDNTTKVSVPSYQKLQNTSKENIDTTKCMVDYNGNNKCITNDATDFNCLPVDPAMQIVQDPKVKKTNNMIQNRYYEQNTVTKSCQRAYVESNRVESPTVSYTETKRRENKVMLHRRKTKASLTNVCNVEDRYISKSSEMDFEIAPKTQECGLKCNKYKNFNFKSTKTIHQCKNEFNAIPNNNSKPKQISCILETEKDFVPVHNFTKTIHNGHSKCYGKGNRLFCKKLSCSVSQLDKTVANGNLYLTTELIPTGCESRFKLPSITDKRYGKRSY